VVPCKLQSVVHNWDFAVSNQGFTMTTCDATGGAPVWAWGASNIAGAPGSVWATVLLANYPNNSGHGIVSPSFTVGPSSNKLEISHYVRTETNFDGCNVQVGGTVIPPTDGYPATISTSTGFYAYCVNMEQGFTGNSATGPSQNWVQRCFDLSAYNGQTIQVEFDFGTDSSVTYRGWALAYVKVGTDAVVPVEATTWGRVKTFYDN
jgi:hypothetical protein